MLNHYLSEMSDAILDHGGTLVAYMGDGIMAVFGAPIEQDDHADRALARRARDARDAPARASTSGCARRASATASGWASASTAGDVMSGNVGSERRLEYTAIGDTTNTASRLEGMTKGTPHQLFVADCHPRRASRTRPTTSCSWASSRCAAGTAKVTLWSLPDVPPKLRDGVAEPLEAG